MKTQNISHQPPRKDRLLHEHQHDPYKQTRKPKEPAVCPECKAVFQEGRWNWAAKIPPKAEKHLCQACLRIADNYPAGAVTLSGAFVIAHKPEIRSLVKHQEAREKETHPLHRIMRIQEQAQAIIILTTDIFLPKKIGDALRDAYAGDLQVHYEPETYYVRVNWTREN